MARRYVNPNARALPDSPENLADYFDRAFAARTGHALGETPSRDVFSFYAQAAMERDPGLRAQLVDQLRGVSGGARRPGRLPGLSAVDALYRPEAPTAAANGRFTLGSFFAAASHLRKDSPGRKHLEQLRNSYSSEVPSAGGFAIPEDLRSDLVWASLSLGVIRARARVFPTSTLRTGLPLIDSTSNASSTLGGVTAAWVEEGQPIPESTATFARAVVDASKLAVLATTPNELLADAPVWEMFLREAIPDAIAYFEDLAYLTGSGVGQPLGMVSCPAAVSVAKESGQAAATIVWENVVKMAAALLPTSWPRAVWLASSDSFAELATMGLSVGTGGGPVFTSENGMTIFGRPVYFYDFLGPLGTPGDLVLCDARYYGIGDRLVMQVTGSPHVKFLQDETQWKIISRQDARPLLTSALSPRNGASGTLSAFVQLAAR
jgi:HK97 family phage major capsid protein